MKYLLLAVLVFLAGCDTIPRKEVVVQHNYVVRTATQQQKTIPPYPAPINVLKADQSALAQWIVDNERRQLDLESIIRRLIEFYEAPVTPEEKKKAEAAAPPVPASGASE